MAYQQDNSRQDYEKIPALTVTAAQCAELSALTDREGFFKLAPDEVQMIAELTPEARYVDFKRFIYRCGQLGLNPIANEIHMEYKFNKGKAKATHIVHVDAYRKMADRTGLRAGFSQRLETDDMGRYVESTLWRKDAQQPFVSRVYFNEFIGDNAIHKKMPYHMVAKSGEAAAYRQAFPSGESYSQEESANWVSEGPVPAPVPAQRETAPREPQQHYTVAEIKPEPAVEARAAEVKAEPEPSDKDKYKAAVNRLIKGGLTAIEVEQYFVGYFGAEARTPQTYLTALALAEQFIEANGMDEFRKNLRGEDKTPAAVAHADEDPAILAARRDIQKKFPAWAPELLKVSSMWCADRMQTADQLAAFLIAHAMTATTSPGRMESFLAITRHVSTSQAAQVLAFVKASGMSFSELEGELSKLVGFDVRTAEGSPAGAVIGALGKLQMQVGGKAAA